MMDTSVEAIPANEWELSKENVQPLRQGRKFSSLSAALQPQNTDQQSKLKEQKQVFEAELRTYSGEDPLDVWDRYIKWTEQNFPKGARDGNLQSILERCVGMFKDDPRYSNDQRYVEAWIKFANFCSEPLEIYSFLHNHGIGTQLTVFYKAWTWELERIGNTKKADAIYQQAIQKMAMPTDKLIKYHSEFQARVAARAAGQLVDPMEDEVDSVDQRSALGALKGTGKKKQVGTTRIGAVKQGNRGLGLKQQPLQAQIGQSFQVFNDENASQPSPMLPPQTGEWKNVPHKQEKKENEQKAGIWTNAKIKQRTTGVVPVSAVSSYNAPAFNVHVDEHADQPMLTPRKLPETGSQVLSARKAEKKFDPLHNINTMYQNDPNQRPMYCKHKIYCGAEEYSFEELRAVRWKVKRRRQEEMALEEQRRRLKEQQDELLRQQQEALQKQQEEMRQRQLEFERQQQEMMEQQRLQLLQQQEQFERERQRQQQLLEQQLQSQMAAKAVSDIQMDQRENVFSSQRLAMNDASLHGNTENIAPQTRIPPRTPNAALTPSFNQSCNNSVASSSSRPRSTGPTPDSSYNQFRGSFNRNTPSRGPITAPSPTVNTKEALQVVMGMFNNTLDIDKELGFGTMEEPDFGLEADFAATSTKKVPDFVQAQMPFTIFDETKENKAEKENEIQIYCDEDQENRPPSGYQNGPKQSSRAGILQPSAGVHFVPLEQQEQMDQGEEESPGQNADDDFAMEGIEPLPEQAVRPNHDATLAPLTSFAVAAHMASTPFNPLNDQNCLPTPPLSAIRLDNAQDLQIEKMDDKENVGVKCSGFGQAVRVDASAVEESFDVTKMAQPSKINLSPIMEKSDEDVKSHHSHGSSVASSQHSHQSNNIEASFNHSRLNLDENNHHEIDTTMYMPPDMDEKTEQILNMSVAIDPNDPFDEELVGRFLSRLPEPISSYSTYHEINENLPDVKTGVCINLGEELYTIESLLGQGGFAQVFKAGMLDALDMTDLEGGEQKYALKIQKPCCPWEYYICTELHKRLGRLQEPVDMRGSVMSVKQAYFFNNGSCFVNDFMRKGTLLSFANQCKIGNTPISECVALFLTTHILRAVEQIHKCNIIHGDIKPDNFMLQDFSSLLDLNDESKLFETPAVYLIDFGRSIDMTMFPPGTSFLAKVNTSGFQCIEMKTDRPWTYQTDLFGIVGTIHVLVFGEYMKVYQANGRWRTNSKFKRWWDGALWQRLFDQLLNVPSCDELPSLTELRKDFESSCFRKLSEYDDGLQNICAVFEEKS